MKYNEPVSVLALGMRHANRTFSAPCNIAICGLSGSAVFCHIVFEYKTCVLIFTTTFVRNISHYKENSVRFVINGHKSSCEVPVIFVRFCGHLSFFDRFSKKYWDIKFNEKNASS